MAIRSLLHADRFDTRCLAATLYDPTHCGGVLVSGLLTARGIETLLSDILQEPEIFQKAPESYLNARQDFSLFYAGEADEDALDRPPPALLTLRDQYAVLCRNLAPHAGFRTPGVPDSIAVQRYRRGSTGITSHRDQSCYINLISVFVLQGAAELGVSRTREGPDATVFHACAGDLLLLRAPRIPEERTLRPYHFVGSVLEERLSVVLRERTPARVLS